MVLDADAQQLEEVSIVGYSTQRKVSVVGAITSIKPTTLNVGGVTSVSNALAGRVAGLIGVQQSGEPAAMYPNFGSVVSVHSEPIACLNTDRRDRPRKSSLNELAPEDIESFSVLKDATATAVYGAKGANGVVLINTKRGVEGKVSINGSVKTMIETLPRLPNYLRAYDYARLANEAKVVRGDKSVYSPEIFDIIKYNMGPGPLSGG